MKNVLTFLVLGVMTLGSAFGQISGTAFRDYNGNGVQEGGEPGRGDIIVNAYSNATLPAKDQLVASTTTASDGTYVLNPPSYPVRIEFIIPDGFCNMASDEDYPAANGGTYGTSIQFAQASGETHDFVINYPYDFSTDDNPFSYLAVLINGDPLAAGGNGADLETMIRFNYKNSGHASNSGRGNNSGDPWDKMSTAKQTGSIWGVAFSRQAKKIWMSASIRRHAGIGPLGSGGIYWMDAAPPYDLVGDLKFINFDELGIPTSDQISPYTDALTGQCSNVVSFSPVLGTNVERGLPGDITQPSADPAAWDQVGKLSFGDMDISSDGRYLYVMNLYDRKLYEIDLVDPYNPQVPTVANAASRIKGYDIPSPCGGVKGEHRAWGIKYARNKVYIGIVCSAQNADGSPTGGTAADMDGSIYEFDAVTKVFNPTALTTLTFDYRDADRPWLPWRADWWRDAYERNGSPIISDIELDANGNFILGITDRHGSQAGHRNADLCGNCCNDHIAMVGDIIQAVRDGAVMDCEYSFQLVPEYYKDNEIHTESTMGALSVHFTADFDGVLTTYMDPIDIYSSGVTLYDNLTGNRQQTPDANGNPEDGYETTYSSNGSNGKFGKANSLGDVETFEIVPPVEIGNLVWRDLDGDGIQDGGEPGIAGVTVELLDAGMNVVSTTMTDADGGFYFNHTNVNVPDGPDFNTDYKLRIASTDFNGGNGYGPLDGTLMTLSNETGSGPADYSDNDATDVGGLALIMLTTGSEGQNNHTYDFGFVPCPVINILEVTSPANNMVCSDFEFDCKITHDPNVDAMQIRYNVGMLLTETDLYGGAGTKLTGPVYPPSPTATMTTVNGLTLPANTTPNPIVYNLYALRDPANNNFNDPACQTMAVTQITVNPETQEATITPNATVCDRPNGPDPNVIDLMTLVTAGDMTGTWEDTGGSGGLVGSVFTATTAMTDMSYIFTYRVTGTGPDGSTCEDNLYEALIFVKNCGMDLALQKTTNQLYVQSGGNASFDIKIYNQGFVTAGDITITDYVPSGFEFVAADNPGWNDLGGGKIEYVITNSGLAPGANTTISIVLKALPGAQAGDFVNEAEISKIKDENGNVMNDLDSTPDDDPNNDNDVVPGGPDDDEINEDGLNNPGDDEDDNDVAEVKVFDLALTKVLNGSAPFHYGDLLDFTITITNQGEVVAKDIEITDYVPAGLEYIPGNNPGWSPVATTAPTYTITNLLAPGASTEIHIKLVLHDSDEADAWLNYAEIKSSKDEDGNDTTNSDWDSTPDDDISNDMGGTPNTPEDNHIDDDGNDSDGDGIKDEDDHDPALVPVFDMALRKINMTAGPYTYGQTVTFKITVFNQGNITAKDVQITDYIPSGFSFNAGMSAGWNGADPFNPTYNFVGPIAPRDSASITIVLNIEQTDGGDTDWDNYAEITSTKDDQNNDTSMDDADSMPDTDAAGERAVKPGDVADNDITSIDKGGEEDDHDPARVEIFDLALQKVTNNNGPFEYGEVVEFTIKVYNQGNLAAKVVDVVDYLPAGLKFANIAANSHWAYDVNTRMAITTILNLEPGTSRDIALFAEVQAVEDDFPRAWYNEAEIKYAEDENDEPRNGDIDSDFDMNPDNDNDVECDSPEDDHIDDDGNDGDGDGITDEDDNDIEWIKVYDLALKKELVTVGPYNYGDLISFKITVYNQGSETVKNVDVTDYIPAGYSFNGGLNPGWNAADPQNPIYTITEELASGEEKELTIVLTLENTDGGEKDWINYTEITAFDDKDGVDQSDEDADSNPNSDGPDERAVEPGGPGDDDIHSHDKGGEEDDHDPAGVEIYDLALRKKATIDGPYIYGQVVPFEITIFNQGNQKTQNVDVIDYIPEGLTFMGSNEPQWTYFALSRTATTKLAIVIAPGDSAKVTLLLRVDPTGGGAGDWTNRAEITGSEDMSGTPRGPMDDIDSMADTDPDNDTGGRADVPGEDDNIDGDKYIGEDEDDSDPARLEIIDLALKNVLTTPEPYNYGQKHTYALTVYNQGNEPAREVKVTNFVPEGYSYDSGINPGWSLDPNSPMYIIDGPIGPGDSTVITIMLNLEMTDGGSMKWIDYAMIASSKNALLEDRTNADADSYSGTDGVHERLVKPGSLYDDVVDQHYKQDNSADEDDHDPAGPDIFDLAVYMQDDTDILADYGDDVEFTITVFNQGNIDSRGYTLTDYVPKGFKFNAGSNAGWVYDAGTRQATYHTDDILSPGSTQVLELVLEAQPTLGMCDMAWTNVVEISEDFPVRAEAIEDIDSSPDTDRDNDPGGAVETASDDVVHGDGKHGGGSPLDTDPTTDEDDQDPEIIRVFDLALKKELITQEVYTYGETHEFKVTVINQGNEVMTDVQITDYLPVGYEFNAVASAGWDGTDPSNPTYVIDRIEPCDTIEVALFADLQMTDGGANNWINYSEITEESDEDGINRNDDEVDSTPQSDGDDERDVNPGDPEDDDTDSTDEGGEEDDHDPAGPNIFDLALYKTSNATGPFNYGDEIPFQINVLNQGNIVATDIELVEYVPIGYQFNAVSNPGWSYNAVTRMARTTEPGPLAAGDTVTSVIVLELLQAYEPEAWDNYVEIEHVKDDEGNPKDDDDLDSTPDNEDDNDQGGEPNSDDDDKVDEDGKNDPNGDEDDHDPHRIEVVDYALKKWVKNKAPYYIPGDTVPFTLTVYNQGNVWSGELQVKDYMPQGYVFDGTINVGWTNVGGTLEYTHVGQIAPQDSVEISLNLIVQIASQPTLDDWTNWGEIGSVLDTLGNNRDGDDADSDPGTDAPHERAVEPEGPDDNNVKGDHKNKGEDEDDHDPEKVEVTGALGDTVWDDLNGNGVQDPGEPGVEGIVATLYKCDGTFVRKDTTDAEGFYFFDFLLPLMDYYVVFDIGDKAPEYAWTFQDEGGDDERDSDVNAAGVGPCTTIDPGERDSTYDAGIVELAAIGNYVWEDRDGDGLQEANEPGIPGVKVILYQSDGTPVGVQYTDGAGKYLFEYLMPGDYYLEFQYADKWSRTYANVGADDFADSDVDDSQGPNTTAVTHLDPGELDETWDLGLYMCIEIGDFIWFDWNADGVQDPAENGLNGVRVYLIDATTGEAVAETITRGHPKYASDDGYYLFCVRPGSYYLRVQRPGNLAVSGPFRGGDDAKDSDINHANGLYTSYTFTVYSGDEVHGLDAGFHHKATMGNLVWRDSDADGIQDSNEPPVEGVIVQAYSEDNMMMSEDVTDHNGEYIMDGLSRGSYYLKYTLPDGLTFTAPNASNDESMDSDVDGSNGVGTTPYITVNPGEHEPDIDAGLVAGALAVTYKRFTGWYGGDHNGLKWEVLEDLSADRYELERRHISETQFRVVNTQQAEGVLGEAEYVYDDRDIGLGGLYFYRVKQYERNGGMTISEVIQVYVPKRGSEESTLTLYPNPTRDNMKVVLQLGSDARVSGDLYDMMGKRVLGGAIEEELESGVHEYELHMEELPQGVYIFKVTIGDEEITRRVTLIK